MASCALSLLRLFGGLELASVLDIPVEDSRHVHLRGGHLVAQEAHVLDERCESLAAVGSVGGVEWEVGGVGGGWGEVGGWVMWVGDGECGGVRGWGKGVG